jgi:hypothetical protein
MNSYEKVHRFVKVCDKCGVIISKKNTVTMSCVNDFEKELADDLVQWNVGAMMRHFDIELVIRMDKTICKKCLKKEKVG